MPADRKCLLLCQWPEQDRLAWERGTTKANLFDESGAGADWSPRSRRKAEQGYGKWLEWLGKRGLLEDRATPGVRVTELRVADYVAELSTVCASYTLVCRVLELCDAMRVLASG
jgi:hypothetical protein